MKVHSRITRAICSSFGAVCVQMAQLGGLTVNERNEPTIDQRYQHAYVHGIPRYGNSIPFFMDKWWPDPQFDGDKFSALHLDPATGLPIVIPTTLEIAAIIGTLRKALQVDVSKNLKTHSFLKRCAET